MNRHELGRIGENSAALWLEKQGWQIIGRNVRFGHDEIDLIAENEEVLAFVEVKTRRQYPAENPLYGKPAEAVDQRKQTALLRAAEAYLSANPTDKIPRIDVIEVYVDPGTDIYKVLKINHFENAVRKSGKFSYSNNNKRYR